MLGAEKHYEERTVKPSNINNRGYEQASTLGFSMAEKHRP